jgi:hypothetical protein
MSPQSALVRTWLRLLRTIIDSETALVNVRCTLSCHCSYLFVVLKCFKDLQVLCLGFYRPFIYEVVRQTNLSASSDGRVPFAQWLNNEDVDFLFGNVETAFAVHASFLTTLEWQFAQWPNPGWGGFAGAFRLLFSSLRVMVSSFGGNPQRLSRQTYERMSLVPEFNALVQQV